MSRPATSWARRCRPLLGTLVEVATPAAHAGPTDDAFAAVARVQAAMSFHDEGSDLARLRRAAPGTAVRVDPWTVAVLRLAVDLHGRTDGLFDPCVGRELVADGLLPRPAGIDPNAVRGTLADLTIIDDVHLSCRVPMLLDLGGIAKGFAVDRAIATLAEAGVDTALVNAGGDLRVLGDEAQPIHLRGTDDRLEGVLMLADGALASSANPSDGRSAVPHRGRRGEPVASDHAVSVVAPECVLADAMTKVAMADPELAGRLLEGFGGAIVDRRRLALAA